MARFPDFTPWRFVVTGLDSSVITFLDHLATDRKVVYGLNAPAQASGRVPSDNPEVNILGTDGQPFLQEGVRLMYGFRREGDPTDDPYVDKWVCRFAGIPLQMEDTAAEDAATTPYTAWDPWQYLLTRPLCNLAGSLPGPDGFSFSNTKAGVIIATLLRNTIINHGNAFVDAGATYGGTGYWSGVIEDTVEIDIVFEQGCSVGEAWQQVCDLAVADIILNPIYDPINRPGYLCELNIYPQAGTQRDEAIFAWDMPSRSLTGLSRLRDGTSRANKLRFAILQGGTAGTIQTDAASVTKFGEYWDQQFFPAQSVVAAVNAMAQLQLTLRNQGKVTVTIDPASERSPDPFREYYLGDTVPIYASARLREALSGYSRIYGIPIDIDDNGVEHITQLLTSAA